MYLRFVWKINGKPRESSLLLKNPDDNNVYRTYFYSVSWNYIMLTAVVPVAVYRYLSDR